MRLDPYRARFKELSDGNQATMMTSRDRVIRTLNHEPADRAPRDLWVLPAVEICRGDELAELLFRYPTDIQKPDFQSPCGKRARGTPCEIGEYTDAWGCTWQVTEPGTLGQLKSSPLDDLSKLAEYHPPLELVEEADLKRVNRGCAATSCFVLARTESGPFQRLQYLHGRGAALEDLAGGNKPASNLLSMLHDFFRREMQMWASTDVDGVALVDDWGSQDGLWISPAVWRELFKPLYREYCEILHEQDKFAFFHSRGDISEIFADLVQIGVDAIHCDLFSMDIESLAERFRGQITFWGQIDGPHVLSPGTPEAIRAAVRRVRRALDYGRGGVIAQCEWGPNVPFENVAAVFEQWLAPLPVHA